MRTFLFNFLFSFLKDDGRGTGDEELDEEEMTALNLARDLDRMEREQENAGHSMGEPGFAADEATDNSGHQHQHQIQMPNSSSSSTGSGLRKGSSHKLPQAHSKNGGSGKKVAAKINVEPIVHVASSANSSTDLHKDDAVSSSSSHSHAHFHSPSSPSTPSSLNSERREGARGTTTTTSNKTPSLVNESAIASVSGGGEPVPGTSGIVTGTGSGSGILAGGSQQQQQQHNNSHGSPHSSASNSGSIEAHVVRISNI